jgi:hypothetical protein
VRWGGRTDRPVVGQPCSRYGGAQGEMVRVSTSSLRENGPTRCILRYERVPEVRRRYEALVTEKPAQESWHQKGNVPPEKAKQLNTQRV